MLEAALKSKIKTFIFASSSSIYGECDKFPQKEDFLPRIISPYALTKLAGEYYCRIFFKMYGLNTVSLRYFNVFGPRQALDDEYAVVIPKFITCILKDKMPPVHGTGKQSRDFTYIDNVVQANLLALESKGLKGEVFNIASGKDYSILELVKFINLITGKEIASKITPPRKGDVIKTLADISFAGKVLKYRPQVDFKTGLKKTINWFRKDI
jgi:UDP-glucose 4-epimerase